MLPKLFFISILSFLILTHSYNHQCLDHQKRLLLELKNELIFNSSISRKLVQWNRSDDCCKWYGVGCDGAGNIMSLQLDDESISGGIGDSSSLFRLEYLQRLNLAYNYFNSIPIPIPRGIHNLTSLTHLNLSYAGFTGQIPLELTFMTRLVSLDISFNYFHISNYPSEFKVVPLTLEYPNLEMLVSNLTGLRELYLDDVNITSSDERREWSHIISSYLPNLTTLSLSDCDLSGPLAKSFWQLHSMSILILDSNNLSRVAPDLFTNFPSLTTLSLANCQLKGFFPETIFHLPTLQNLDLYENEELSVSMPSFTETGYSFKSIGLSGTNLTGSLPNSISNLKALSWINLSDCKLTGSIIPSTFANLTQLVHVDLSGNFFTGSLSSSMFEGFSNLLYLDLTDNLLSGSIPHTLFCLPSLHILLLSGNKFNGQVDEFPLVNVSKIEELGLSGNRLQGPIPDSFFHLQNLQYLVLAGNMLNGSFQLDKIRSLPNLTALDLSDNNLSVDVGNHNSSTYQLPHLTDLSLASCNLSAFPDFIKHSDYLGELDLSNNRIAGEIPIWIWKSQLEYLNLSLNLLTDFQKPYHIPASLQELDLQSNQLRGELQLPLPSNIGNNDTFQALLILLLGNNNLSGLIPTSICSATNLYVLDLSHNRLSGNIPSCIITTGLVVLDLGRNNISGLIPDHFPINSQLQYLDLNKNNLQGKVPKSLQNCKWLELMNIGGNMIEDSFPCMLPSNMSVVVLHSNRFHGEVKCRPNWPRLQILDISSNSFSGTLEPFNFSSWKAMVVGNYSGLRDEHSDPNLLRAGYHKGVVRIIMKGLDVQLVKILPDFTAIDFSYNNFQGNMPNAIGNLSSLHLLNLSHNALNGSIPKSFDHMRALESLDLSQNSLTGAIPEEFAMLTFLQVLNLSYNNLVGNIPNGPQLQTFSADSFKGNPGLCGFNLNIRCTNHTDDDIAKVEDEEEKREIEWGYVIATLGYVVGLGSIAWMLLFCQRFRKKCFDKIDEVVEDIFTARDMRRRRRATARRTVRNNRARRQ